MNKLKFAKGNAKLAKHVATFSLPAGHSCPAALLCQSRANRNTGVITDGQQCQFRCYAASGENLFRNVRVSRWRNFDALRACDGVLAMADLIERSMPVKGITHCRIHASGDFFSQAYFDAWLLVAQRKPNVIFYAYTKALPFWIKRFNDIPANLRLVASRGGRYDNLIDACQLRSVRVVLSETEAKKANLPLDHDDSHVWQGTGDFVLLIHGTQPAGTYASKVLYALRRQGKNGYKAYYFAHYSKGKPSNKVESTK